MSKGKSYLLAAVIVVVCLGIAVAAVAGGGNTDKQDDKKDDVVITANATTLLPHFSVMPDGWINGGSQTIQPEADQKSAASVTFVNTGYSQQIMTEIFVYDTIEHAKSHYESEKATAEGTYKVKIDSRFDGCFHYEISATGSHIYFYEFYDNNVYGRITGTAGVIGIYDSTFGTVLDDVQKNINDAIKTA